MQNSFTAQPMDIVKFYKSLNLLSFITFKSSVNLWWFTILQEYNKQLHHCTLYRVYFRTQQNIVNMHHAENSVKRETSFNKSRGSTWHSWNVIFCDKNCVCVCVCFCIEMKYFFERRKRFRSIPWVWRCRLQTDTSS